ncbi:HepT-like ribonuclease domain-containing protein [Hydrogenophaga sp.]
MRNLQTLSEATQHLPDALNAKHPNVPRREISGFRNILVHNYLGD